MAVAVAVAVAVPWAVSRGSSGEIVGSDHGAEVAPAAVTGIAELLVATYLTAGETDGQRLLRTLYPVAPELPKQPAGSRFVPRAVVVGVERVGEAHWAVTVAAEVLVLDDGAYRPDSPHYYLVGIVETAEGPLATSLPSRIPAASPAEVPAVATGAVVEDAALLALVEGFLSGYAAGSGDLRPFLAAGSGIVSITPAPYRTITIDSVAAIALGNDQVHLRAVGTATDTHGSALGIEHHLVVTTEGGAWKVVRLAPGPPMATELAAGDG